MISESTFDGSDIRQFIYQVKNEGPDPDQYQKTSRLLRNLYDRHQSGTSLSLLRKQLMLLLGEHTSNWSLLGLLYQCAAEKAQWYEWFDRVLTSHIPADPTIEKWDRFTQRFAGNQSLRWRQATYQHLLIEKLEEGKERLQVLYVGPGAGRFFNHLFELVPADFFMADVVDTDRNSHYFNAQLLSAYQEEVTLHCTKLEDFQRTTQYDIIICPFLLDACDDEAMVRMLQKLHALALPDGEFIFSTFSDRNPSRIAFNLFGWEVTRRSESDLFLLLLKAGCWPEGIQFVDPEDGVSWYVRVRV